MRNLGTCLFFCAALLAATSLHAAEWPERPIKLVVPFAAGGANDIVARLLQIPLEKALGQPIVIENRVGASGIIGTDFVAKAEPDGYTFGVALATHSVNPAVNVKLPYDTERDLMPVILIGKNPMLFLVNAKVPAKSMRDFAALAKAKPDTLNYASPGAASQAHLVISQWSRIAGVKVQHVPYRGGAPATLATISGETQFTVMSSLVAAPHVAGGELRALATGGLKRDPHFPDVPTLDELGYKDVEAVTWVGLFAPAGTPQPIVTRLNKEIDRIIHEPDIAAKLDGQGIVPEGGPPQALGDLVSREIRRWTAVAKENGIVAGR